MKSTMIWGIDQALLNKIHFYYFSEFSSNKINKTFAQINQHLLIDY